MRGKFAQQRGRHVQSVGGMTTLLKCAWKKKHTDSKIDL